MITHFALDPAITYLNHGTVGAPPRRVLAVQQAIRDEIELQPARYLLRELSEIRVGVPRAEPPRLRTAAAEVAAFFGARGEDLVFVDNATTGANAVLRSLPLAPGDEILVTSLGYGSVTQAAREVARQHGAVVREVAIPAMTERPEEVVEAIAAALGSRTRLAIVDHIASDSALLLPVAEIAARCRARGVPIFVDGAHAPGAIALDLPSIGADWYVGNLHKWAWAPRSAAILWVAPERQAALHPPVISWGLDLGFTTELISPGQASVAGSRRRGARALADRGARCALNHDLLSRLASVWRALGPTSARRARWSLDGLAAAGLLRCHFEAAIARPCCRRPHRAHISARAGGSRPGGDPDLQISPTSIASATRDCKR
jgi:isopenicillin-N epimerase